MERCVDPDHWVHPERRSMLGLFDLHHRSLRTQYLGLYLLDPPRSLWCLKLCHSSGDGLGAWPNSTSSHQRSRSQLPVAASALRNHRAQDYNTCRMPFLASSTLQRARAMCACPQSFSSQWQLFLVGDQHDPRVARTWN